MWTNEVEADARRRARFLAMRWGQRGDDTDDAEQSVAIDVWRALPSYDPARASLGAWLDRVVKWSLMDWMTAQNKNWKREMVATDLIEGEDGNHDKPPLADPHATDAFDDIVGLSLVEDELAQLRPLLTKMEDDCLTLALNGLLYREIAEELGCGQKGVDNALLRARTKARQMLADRQGRTAA